MASAQPPTPSGLSAVPGSGQVNLEWTPDSSETPGVTAYYVSRQLWDLTTTPTPNPTGSPTPIATVLLSSLPATPGTPSFRDSQVTNGRLYLYQVQGTDSTGLGLAASVMAAPFFAPYPVQPVTVLNLHDNALDLFWGVPPSSYPVSFYQVYRYAYLTCTITNTPTITATPTPTPDPTDTPSFTSTPDPTDTPTDSPTGTFSPPPSDTPTNSFTATHSPTLTPTSSPTLTFTFTATFPNTPVPAATILSGGTPIATVTVTTYSDTSASPSAALAYYYAVMAVDSAGNSSSAPATGSNPALPSGAAPPAPPVLTGVLSQSAYGVSLIWSGNLPSEAVTNYQLLANGVTLASFPVAVLTPTMTYFDNSIPGTGFPVTYQVRAQNANGTSNSNPFAQGIADCVQGPIQVTPVASPAGVTISWSPATNGTYGLVGYAIYRGLNGVPANNPTPITSGSPTATPSPTPFATLSFSPSATLTLTPVVDAPIVNHMFYWVQPLDRVGHGGLVGAATPPQLNLAPTPPSNLSLGSPAGNNQIQISWSPGSGGFFGTPSYYALYRSTVIPVASLTPTNTGTLTPTASFTPVATLPYGQTSYLDIVSGLSAGATVGYQMALVDSAGNPSDMASSGNVVTLSGLVAPATPQVLPFAASSTSQVFTWANNPPADAVTAYGIFLPQSLTPVATVLATQGPAPTLVFAPTPTPWAAGYYYLVAQNAAGNSAPATLSGIPVPPYQVTVVLTPGTRNPLVSWNMTPAAVSTPPIDSFGIYRSLSSNANFTPVATVALGTNNYPDVAPAATAGVTYYYRVTARAGGALGQLAESPLVPNPDAYGSAKTWPNPPPTVTVVSGTSQSLLLFGGNAPQEDVSSYSVFSNPLGTPTPIATVLATQSPTPTYAFLATETPGNQSGYFVVANNAQGPSDPSQILSVLVPPAMTPTAALTPPPYFTPTGTITPGVWISGLSYSAAVSGYNIYRQSPPELTLTPGVTATVTPAFNIVGTTAFSTPFFEDPGQPGWVNNYQVVATSGSGLSANPTASAQLAVTLWPAPPALAMAPGPSAVTVNWATPIGNVPVTLYNIYRNLYPTATPVLLAQTTPPMTSYLDSNVTVGSPYIYWVDAQNASGGSGLSTPQTVVAVQPPTLYVTPLPERNQLAWAPITVAPSSLVSGYVVYKTVPTPSVTPIFIQVGSIVEPLSNTAYVDSAVSDGVSYLYQIAPAVSNQILGPFSNTVGVTVYPQAVGNLVAVSGDGLVQLRWTYQGPVTNSYFITRQLGTAPAGSAQTIKTGFQGVNFTDTNVTDKNFYIYNVYTVDAFGLTAAAYASATALPAAPPIVANPQIGVFQDQGGNNLTWFPANTSSGASALYDLYNPVKMYPLGGYGIYRSTDGGSVYEFQPNLTQIPTQNSGPPAQLSLLDSVQLVGGTAFTYLIQAFDLPPDLPVPLSQAVTQGWVHTASYNPITAFSLRAGAALDRNAIRPFGAPNEKAVHVRIAVTTPGNVNIKVYTLDGTFVKELVNTYFNSGVYGLPGSSYPISWDATNKNGNLVASGVYLFTIEMAGHQEFQKVAVIK